MNLRVYLPEQLAHTPPDGERLLLRLECMNSVEGSSRLLVFLGWLRWVCANGMVFGETEVKVRRIHSQLLDVELIPEVIRRALDDLDGERKQLARRASIALDAGALVRWVDKNVARAWGKKAACRAYHICRSGWDVEYEDPFAPDVPSQKAVRRVQQVPGAAVPARTLYDLSQALAWIATNRANTEERLQWQASVPDLVERLA